MKKVIKIVVITLVILGLCVGGVYGGYRYNRSKKVAKVVSFSSYGMDDYYGDSITSYGTVESDSAQAVYLSSAQKIKEIKVAEGDEVKKGDVLLVVESDTEDVAGKELELKKAEIDLKSYELSLNKLKKITPVPDAEDSDTNDVKSSKEYRSKTVFKVKAENAGKPTSSYDTGDVVAVVEYDIDGTTVISTTYYDGNATADAPNGNEISEAAYKALFSGAAVLVSDASASSFYDCVDSNSTHTWVSATQYIDKRTGKVLGQDTFDENNNQLTTYSPSSTYSVTELNDAIFTAEQAYKKQDIKVRKLKRELSSLKESANNGEILAKVDGKVTKLQDENNINYNQSFMTITGTDVFYIRGSIGEYYLESIKVGDTCTVNSWETGASADATITEIDSNPSNDSNGYYGDGNPNSSQFGFKASFDVNSGIDLGDAVDITLSPAGQQGGIYVYNAFVRKDKKGYFMMRRNEDGLLERVDITVGKSLWGSYYEITSGNMSMDDYIAFPYGTGAMEGVTCEETDWLD